MKYQKRKIITKNNNTHAKVKKDELFDLVNTMTSSERRNFIIWLGAYKGKYTKNKSAKEILFHAMCNLKTFNKERLEKKLRKAFADPEKSEKFLARLALEKIELNSEIRQFFRKQNAHYAITIQVRELLADAKILIDRGLPEHARKILKEAKEAAKEISYTFGILEANKEERTILHSAKGQEELGAELLYLIREEKEQLENLQAEFRYQDFYDRMAFFRKDMPETSTDLLPSDFWELIQQEEAQGPSPGDLPDMAQLRKLQALSVYYYRRRQFDKSFSLDEEVLEWWHQRPHIVQDNMHRYMLSLKKMVDTGIFLKREIDFQQIRTNWKKLLAFLPMKEPSEFRFIDTPELWQALNLKKLDDAKRMSKIIEEGDIKYASPVKSRLINIFNIAIMYFLNGDNADAEARFEATLMPLYNDLRPDLIPHALIFSAICSYNHYMDGYDRPEPILRKLKTLSLELQKEGNDPHLEIVIGYLIKVLDITAQETYRTPVLLQMEEYLNKLTREQENSGGVTGASELLFWARNQITGKPIRRIYLESEI